MNSFYAYKPFTHQHVPEIEQELEHVGDWTNELVFMTHSLPVSRGIFASIYVETKRELTEDEMRTIFADYYRDSFFVRLVNGSPDINWVKTTNFCDSDSQCAESRWWSSPRSTISSKALPDKQCRT